ncbi:TIGR04197 family type VII secretion effector [Oceanobacillus sp. FSL W7-1293]|uniref:TIGR04197 family type VII secretion effector n=1 Tax=Oceanobacillus sp. FSL W7-1293 TaxID=2921699 RepID=UPI0030CBC400
MAEEVGIKISEFNANINSLQSAVSSIDSSMKISRELEKTNIEPFTKDLEKAIEAIKLLERYKQMLDADVLALDNVGKEMVENDEELARVSGPQIMS